MTNAYHIKYFGVSYNDGNVGSLYMVYSRHVSNVDFSLENADVAQ